MFNKDLKTSIDAELKVMHEAFALMKKKGVAMTSQNFEDTINGLKKPVEYVNKSLIKRFAEYVENGY